MLKIGIAWSLLLCIHQNAMIMAGRLIKNDEVDTQMISDRKP